MPDDSDTDNPQLFAERPRWSVGSIRLKVLRNFI
jgi:hypothetical protein